MSETIDDLDKLTIEAKARARRRRQQDRYEAAIPRNVTICPTCGAAVPDYVAQYGCRECGVGATKVETTKRG